MVHRASDERPHDPPAGVDGWSETWSFDFASADGDLGGWSRFTRLADRCWYQAMLAGPRRQLLAVIDHDVPFRSNPLELRTTGLWADHTCETPFEHWTLGLEVFALGVDDPLELYRRELGDRVPLGFDLEWEADGPVQPHPGGPGVDGYEQASRVHGEILVGDAVIDFEGVGNREHQWGRIDWPSDDGWHLSGMAEGHRRWSVDHRGASTTARVVDADGSVQVLDAMGTVDLDDDGLPVAVHVTADGLVVRSEVLAATPLRLDLDGQEVRRPRALCRHRMDGGWIGVGWLELRGDPRVALSPV